MRKQDGFTVVEIIVTVGIILSLGSMAALSVPSMIESYRLKETVSLVTGAIREAQVKAVEEGRYWRVRFEADGGGYYVERAPTAGVNPWDCSDDPAVWTEMDHERFYSTTTLTSWSRSCLAFAPTGKAAWPNAEATVDPTLYPWTGGASVIRLVDGWTEDSPPSVPTNDADLVLWRNNNPVINLDLKEQRNLFGHCVGMYSYNTPPVMVLRYPSSMTVQASNDQATWATLTTDPIPPDIAVGRPPQRTCVAINANGTYRYLRIALTRKSSSAWIVLDEIDVSTLSFTFQGTNKSTRLAVSPVTGRTQVVK
ncbi:MAG TPA: hypothetical protein VD902_05475 [Symbiobacteriaceae bacterium]|nr:hypothetical protein [Symbiobacteriaceae bacterium]